MRIKFLMLTYSIFLDDVLIWNNDFFNVENDNEKSKFLIQNKSITTNFR